MQRPAKSGEVQGVLDRARNALSAKRYRDAHAHCIAVLALDPNVAEAYYLLGVLAVDHHNHVKAIELFQLSHGLEPYEAKYPAYLAMSFISERRPSEAIRACRLAETLHSQNAAIWDTIGVAYSHVGLHDDAMRCYRVAVSLSPNNPKILLHFAMSLQFAGDFEAANRAYSNCISIDPGCVHAYSGLVRLKQQTLQDNRIAALIDLFAERKKDANAALILGHAIAKSYEDIGNFEEAMSWLRRAKAIKSRSISYRVTDDIAALSMARENAPQSTASNTNDQAIFVVGLPRTGTTLVDRILSSHRQVQSLGELTNFSVMVRRETSTPSLNVLDEDTLQRASAIDLDALGHSYLESVSLLRDESRKFVDKMPLNSAFAGLIHAALPNARIICLRRGAADTCLSNYRQLFATGFSNYNYSLSLEDTAHYYLAFDRLMNHWRNTLPRDRFTEVHYEDLVCDLSDQTRRLLAFCDLEWDEACVRFHENGAPVATASSVQVRSPINSNSVGRWRRVGEAMKPALDVLSQADVSFENTP